MNDKQTEQNDRWCLQVFVRAWGAACMPTVCAVLLLCWLLPIVWSHERCSRRLPILNWCVLACPSTWANRTTADGGSRLAIATTCWKLSLFKSQKIKSHWQSGSLWQRGIQKLLCWQYSSKGQWRGGLLLLESKIIAENMLAWKSVLVLLSTL